LDKGHTHLSPPYPVDFAPHIPLADGEMSPCHLELSEIEMTPYASVVQTNPDFSDSMEKSVFFA